jgi:hypothetical protein
MTTLGGIGDAAWFFARWGIVAVVVVGGVVVSLVALIVSMLFW